MYTNLDGALVVDKYSNASSNAELIEISDNTSSIESMISDVYDLTELVTEDTLYRELKKGNSFLSGYVWNNVASGASVNLHVLTGANPIFNIYNVGGTALTDYGVVIGATVSGNGTLLTNFCKNVYEPLTSPTKVYYDATFTGGSIALPRFFGLSGNVNARIGGSSIEQKAILAPNSHYIYRATNSNTATQERMSINFEWLEITW